MINTPPPQKEKRSGQNVTSVRGLVEINARWQLEHEDIRLSPDSIHSVRNASPFHVSCDLGVCITSVHYTLEKRLN